jgi:hypothetical protein
VITLLPTFPKREELTLLGNTLLIKLLVLVLEEQLNKLHLHHLTIEISKVTYSHGLKSRTNLLYRA